MCVYVHLCACACIIKRGSYLTNHTPLLPFILATHETRINAKSVFGAFKFIFIKDCLSQQFASFFSWGFLNSRCLTELEEVSHSAF